MMDKYLVEWANIIHKNALNNITHIMSYSKMGI